MQIELTRKQYRRLLDLVYIGNWVLNSTRGSDRFSDYDEVEGLLFTKAPSVGMPELIDTWPGGACPSQAYVTGGIHEAIGEYEDAMFFDILAEELARRLGVHAGNDVRLAFTKIGSGFWVVRLE